MSAFRVPFAIKQTAWKGMGVFVTKPIKQGTVMLLEGDVVERSFTPKEAASVLDTMDSEEAERFLRHSYPSNGEFIHCFSRDVAFVNHSPYPTCMPDKEGTAPLGPDTKWIATRDLEMDEEVTHDYSVLGEYGNPPDWFMALFPRIGIEFPSVEMMNEMVNNSQSDTVLKEE